LSYRQVNGSDVNDKIEQSLRWNQGLGNGGHPKLVSHGNKVFPKNIIDVCQEGPNGIIEKPKSVQQCLDHGLGQGIVVVVVVLIRGIGSCHGTLSSR